MSEREEDVAASSSRSAPVVSNLVITANTLVFHTCYCYVKRVITKLWLGDHHLMVDSDVSLITWVAMNLVYLLSVLVGRSDC